MNFKKIVSLLITVSMLFAMSVATFAYTDLSGSYVVEGVASEIAEDGTFTYSLYAYEKDNKDSSLIDLYVGSGAEWFVTLNFDAAAFEIASNATPGEGLAYTAGGSTKGDGYYIVNLTANVEEINLTKDTPFVTFNFKKLDAATDGEKIFEITKVEIAEWESYGMISLDNDNVEFDLASVTLGTPGPTENVAEFVKDTVELTVEGETHNFTDVPVYEGTTSATSFKLKAVYAEGENYLKFNGSETIDVSNIKVDGEGTVTFQVAIIGKPASVTIDKLVIE